MTEDQWTRARGAFDEALALDYAARAAYLAGLPPELREEVESLLEADRAAGDFLEEPAAGIPAGSLLGPYRVLSKIGEGGMGAVYFAERQGQGFTQQVALKVIPSTFVSGDIDRRFMAERRILASLEHPNIVRLFGGGEWEGHRYFAMEFVKGTPITEYCRNLPLREKLAIFRTVCAAIHYAHQNLVVHRDIKPGNILVTADGGVKVLDFGIAKRIDSVPADAGVTRVQPMTLDTASPEQVRSQSVTTATDVYSLGVLLYQLLTGRSPHGGGTSLEETVRLICEVTPEKPSSAAPGIPADLDSIALRALQKDPARRYPSADEFSTDIARFLEGKPVIAREATLRYVASKFVARHRLAVGAAAGALLLVAASAGAAIWQARTATRERALAERRFNETRTLARSLIFDLQPQLSNLPGALPIRRRMIEQTVKYLESLSRDAASSADVMLDIAGSYLRVGDIQGAIGDHNLGDPAAAFRSWEVGSAMTAKVLALNPASAESLRLGAILEGRLAGWLRAARRLDEARQHLDRAVDYADRFQRVSPDRKLAGEVLGSALFAQAFAAEGEAGVTLWQKVLRHYESLMAAEASPVSVYNVALSAKYLADRYLSQGELGLALQMAEKAKSLDEARLSREPGDRRVLLDLTNDIGTIAWVQLDLHRAQDAAQTFKRNLELRQQLAAGDPQNELLSERVARAQLGYGLALAAVGDRLTARQQLTNSLTFYRKMSQKRPDEGVLESISSGQTGLGRLSAADGRTADACRWFLDAQSSLRRAHPDGGSSRAAKNLFAELETRLKACPAGPR